MKSSQNMKITEKDFFDHEYKLYQQQGSNYPLYNILSLAIITSIFTINSTGSERGYSTMNDVKTKKRNKLKTMMVSDLMMIRLNGPNSMEQFEAILMNVLMFGGV